MAAILTVLIVTLQKGKYRGRSSLIPNTGNKPSGFGCELWYNIKQARSISPDRARVNTYLTRDSINMDIVALHRDLKATGLKIEVSEIAALIEQLRWAIADGKIKRSTAPDCNRYPLSQIVPFLLGRGDATIAKFWWDKAIKEYPKLAEHRVLASYSKTAKYQKNTQGIASLTLVGVVTLAAVLMSTNDEPSPSEIETIAPIDPRISAVDDRIYILKDPTNKVLKVGITNDIETRMKHHKSSNPFLVPIAFFPVATRDREYQLHQLLMPYRLSGAREWYTDSPVVRRLIFDFFIDG